MTQTDTIREPLRVKPRTRAPRGFNPYADLMSLVISRPRAGRCRASFLVQPEHLNPNRVAHGGAIYTMADTAMGSAIHSVLDHGSACVTVEIKIHYLKPVHEGRVSCTAKVVQCGKRIAVVEADVKNQGMLVAKAIGTFAVIPRPHTGGSPPRSSEP